MKKIRLLSFFMAFILFVGNCPIVAKAAVLEKTELFVQTVEIQTSMSEIGIYSLENGTVEMKSSKETLWIDRIKELPESIKAFYDVLVEGSDNDGINDVLIDDAYFQNGTLSILEKNIPRSEIASQDDLNTAVANFEEMYEPYIRAAIGAFDRDHPEVFWLKGTWNIGASAEYDGEQDAYVVKLSLILNNSSYDINIRSEKYQTAKSIKNAIELLEGRIDFNVGFVEDETTYGKIEYFNKKLTISNQYNTSDNLNEIADECRECISALMGQTGTEGPVCEGYARAFKVLCDRSGIPCVLVDGQAINSNGISGAHMWNYVQVDDAWYAVDVTWNDPVVSGVEGCNSGYETEQWLLVGSETEIAGKKFIESHPVANTPFPGLSFENGPELSKTACENPKDALYYSSWEEAYEALKDYCGIADASGYTEAQADLISTFLDKWPDILYGATDEDEANTLLERAKAEFDALPLDDEEAMEEHKAFIAEREAVFNEKMAIMESNIANAKWTGDSRFDYETAAREALGTILKASNYDELNSGKAAFDACVSLLVEVGPELKAAQEAAKNELAAILEKEYENITTIDNYYSRIDNCNNEDEIASVVEECKEYMLACVNADIATYRNNKLTKAADYCRSFESKLGAEKFNELKTYYRDNMGALSGATNKADVDRAYNDLLSALESKVTELLNGGGTVPEEPEDVAVTSVLLNKTELTLKIEAEEQLVATVFPENATDKTVTWATSDSSVATVDANGKVTAIAAGSATIAAKVGEKIAECKVTVNANVSDACSNGYIAENCPSKHFSDLDLSEWYHLNVDYVVSQGLMNGILVGEGEQARFAPDGLTTRGMIITILYRMSGDKIDEVKLQNNKFVDVVSGEYYEEAVAWGVEKGIVQGISEDLFAPDNNITREQMVLMLYRYANSLGEDTTERADLSSFDDEESVHDWAYNAVSWANASGMMGGKPTTSNTFILDPEGDTPRCQAAAFIHRFCNAIEK